MAGLRGLAWRGGLTMAARQLAGMAISFGGLVALARLIGPAAYGTYISAFAIHGTLVLLFQWGIDIYLIRKAGTPSEEEIHQAFTLSLVLGAVGAALAWPTGLISEIWIGAPGIAFAVTALFLGMPLQLATLIPSALLQREMAYGKVARAELSGQVALYGGGVAAAVAGLDLEATLIGWWLQQIVMAAAFFGLAGYRPRLVWRGDLLRPLAAFGAGYAISVSTWQMRQLVNPLIVARILGPEAAAGVAVAMRLAEALSFMKTVLWRVSVPALGRVQADPGKIAAGVGEGMRLQVLAVGPALAAFAFLAPWLVPLAFGDDWAAAAQVFPFVAAAILVSAVFSLHASALYVLGRNGDVTAFHLSHVAVLAAVAAIAVPRLGLIGYGYAELAALAAYTVLHARATACLGAIDLGLGAVWMLGFAAPLFVDRLGPGAWAGPMGVLLLPATWRALSRWWSQVKDLAHG